MSKQSLWETPSVHRVERIEATSFAFDVDGREVSSIDLRFHNAVGEACTLNIFGPGETANKFARLAAAINEIFAEEVAP